MGMTEQKIKVKGESGKGKEKPSSRILGFTFTFNLSAFTCFSEVLA
jgi:hypothetical protein